MPSAERFCCDTKCNERQGRGGCPRFPAIADLSGCAPTREQELHAWAVLILAVCDVLIWKHVASLF